MTPRVSFQFLAPVGTAFFLFLAATATDWSDCLASEEIPVYTHKIVNVYPHDPDAFTQGLVFEKGFLYEGTGLTGRSSLRKVALESGKVMKLRKLPVPFFGEGVTIYQNKVFQLTWRSGIGFIYHKESFELLGEFRYDGEGWGLTHDGKRLIMSDGTSTLYLMEPKSFREIGRLEVRQKDQPVNGLNELEWVQHEIYANVWQTERIARIDPVTGRVTGWLDLTGILSPLYRRDRVDVLNGIAYDPGERRLFVTGKLWPKVFEIQAVLVHP